MRHSIDLFYFYFIYLLPVSVPENAFYKTKNKISVI